LESISIAAPRLRSFESKLGDENPSVDLTGLLVELRRSVEVTQAGSKLV
jgi:hypothetical protein